MGKKSGKSAGGGVPVPTGDAVAPSAGRKINYESTRKIDAETRFKPHEIEKVAAGVLRQHLQDKSYDPELCRVASQLISSKISDALRRKSVRSYKHVVMVSIGSLRDRPGVYLGSRCLWNDKTDSFCTVRYQNKSLYAIAMIYGLYFE